MDRTKIVKVMLWYSDRLKRDGQLELGDFLGKAETNEDSLSEAIYSLRIYLSAWQPANFPEDKKPSSEEEILSHCRGMLDKMKGFLQEGRFGKTLRWVGFIIGCIWSLDNSRSEEVIFPCCRLVLSLIGNLVRTGDINRAFVCLGFVQGCFWVTGQYTLEDLMNHNRPDSKENQKDG